MNRCKHVRPSTKIYRILISHIGRASTLPSSRPTALRDKDLHICSLKEGKKSTYGLSIPKYFKFTTENTKTNKSHLKERNLSSTLSCDAILF